MTKVDQFESVFKAAAKTPYRHEAVPIRKVLVLTDLDEQEAATFKERVQAFLAALEGPATAEAPVTWTLVPGDRYGGVDELLGLINETAPDLICTYRSLHSQGWRWSYTLGRYVDILAQETAVPVLLLPHPLQEVDAREGASHAAPVYGVDGTRTVMAMTDHLAGDHHLIHWAVRFTLPGGVLVLSHVEDGFVFDRYMDAISKIPEIDTDEARERIEHQLLREPSDFIDSCQRALDGEQLGIQVEKQITVGHRLSEYRRVIEARDVDLLVLNTKDEDQLAMHGLAYPLVVELRHVPILML
ncbi:MAG: hypothetical protein QNJ98_00980 [Planctomycetota bacterium]|nr:hypothetical protein [Planctomycetota bacterium]